MEKDIERTYVGILDILGFKEIAFNNDHQELIKIYNLFDAATIGGMALFNYNLKNEEFKINTDFIKINSLTISDSIILWTDNLKNDQFINLLLSIISILSEAMRLGIPMRGAIVVGPLSVREEKLLTNTDNIKLTCFGRSIVDAYILCESQNWSGCVISQDCITEYEKAIIAIKTNQFKYTIEQIDKIYSLTSLEHNYLLRKYLVPFKDGKLKEEFVVNWVNEFTPKWKENSIRLSFSKHKKNTNNQKVESLIKNTIEFAKDCPESPERIKR